MRVWGLRGEGGVWGVCRKGVGGVLIIVYNETLLSMGSSRGVGLLYCVGGISLGVLLETQGNNRLKQESMEPKGTLYYETCVTQMKLVDSGYLINNRSFYSSVGCGVAKWVVAVKLKGSDNSSCGGS